jgi:hypothetical protein
MIHSIVRDCGYERTLHARTLVIVRHRRWLGGAPPRCPDKVDHDGLYRIAESQAGYFTAEQALDAGMDRSTLIHHAWPGGRYERVRRPLPAASLPFEPARTRRRRLACPPQPCGRLTRERTRAVRAVRRVPNAVHITLPRAKRGQRARPGVRFHALAQPPGPSEPRRVAGVLATNPERTIVDSLESGTQPEQIELAVRQALERGLTTPRACARRRTAAPAAYGPSSTAS